MNALLRLWRSRLETRCPYLNKECVLPPNENGECVDVGYRRCKRYAELETQNQ